MDISGWRKRELLYIPSARIFMRKVLVERSCIEDEDAPVYPEFVKKE